MSYYVGTVNPADEIGTGTLSTNSNGVTTATFSTHSLPAGTYAITAVYGGDTNYPAEHIERRQPDGHPGALGDHRE